MNQFSKIYAFDDFRFDADKFVLYYKNSLVKNADRKTMQVLAVLLLHPNELTTQDEIIEQVWQDNPHGITANHIGQYISRLRKLFAEFAPDKNYIETARGRGYSFVGDVSPVVGDVSPAVIDSPPNIEYDLPEDFADLSKTEINPAEKIAAPRKFPKFALTGLFFVLILPAAFYGWKWFSGNNNEDEIRHVVKDSQLYESLVLYKNPSAFKEEFFDKYWTAETDVSLNADRTRIRDAVKGMIAAGKHYGEETKCEQFEFQSVEINKEEDFATVRTLEKWFVSIYFNDGTLEKNKIIGPYFIDYIVRKVDGKWLIEKSTTARMQRPTPRLTDVQMISEAKPRQQFFVKITGQDFEPETVYLEVIGKGCPESQPCKVPNIALREFSKTSETVLENVPLTLASGDFRINVRNGNSSASNQFDLKVP